jgi:hypothetical protein
MTVRNLKDFRAICGGVLAALIVLLMGCGDSQTLLGTVDGGDGDTAGDVTAGDTVGPPPPSDADLGDPGWRDSTDAWVPPPPAREPERACAAFDIWSNPGAVYVAMSWSDTDGGPPSDVGQVISVNEGSGWSEFYTVRSTTAHWCEGCVNDVVGMIDGRLVNGQGQLAYISPGSYVVEDSFEASVEATFVVNDDLAYAISTAGETKVIRWNGVAWSPVTAVLPYTSVHALWADESNVFVVGDLGTVLSLDGDTWQVHDAGTLENIMFVWGFAGDDVWISTWQGLGHFDGASWTAVPWPFPIDPTEPCAEGQIEGLWGADGHLFVRTNHRLAMWDGTSFVSLGYWPAVTEVVGTTTYCRGGLFLAALWGNAPDEVFAAVNANFEEAGRRCPDSWVLYWDGTSFHWF